MEFGVAFHLTDLFFHGFSALKLPIRELKPKLSDYGIRGGILFGWFVFS